MVFLAGCQTILGIEDTYVVLPDAHGSNDPSAPIDAMPTQADAAEPDNAPAELIALRLLNAATLEPLNSPVQLTIRGTGRGEVIDEQGAYRTEYADVYESLRFGLSRSATFPVSLVVEARGPGLLATSSPLIIYERRDVTAELRLVSVENLPDGIYLAQGAGMLDEEGRLLADILVETKRRETNAVTASVTAPAGIIMRDNEGKPLSGPIALRLVHHESGNAQSLAAFPGGMDVTTNEGDTLFSTAGLISVEIEDSAGRHATTFEGDVLAVAMMVPSGIMNPDKNRAIADGDTVGLWGHDAETGMWTHEGDVSISGAQESLMAAFGVTHLSLWNLDFKFNKCDESREIEMRAGTGKTGLELVAPAIAQHFAYRVTYESYTGVMSFVRDFRPGDLWDLDP